MLRDEPSRVPLEDYLARIGTGLVPQSGWALSKERAAALDGQLRRLDRARRVAALELRNWTPGPWVAVDPVEVSDA